MNEELPEERYLILAEKWLEGTITPDEEKEYAAWYNTVEPQAELSIYSSVAGSKEAYRDLLFAKIKAARKQGRVIPIKNRILMRTAIAAVTIGLLATGYYWFDKEKARNASATSIVSAPTQNDIHPGTNGAILKLANGTTIMLDTAKNGSVIHNNFTSITKQNGQVVFDGAKSENEIAYNELITPRASQQQITLSDGTKVWLNAASSIRFPTSFPGKERVVEISGEAYFEVAKNALKPFIVKINTAEIKVLGTHFNVMAYTEENSVQTTLLEGSVQFNNGNNTMRLQPGQQSQLQASGEIKLVKDADVELVTAWKNGLQSFSNADIKTIMRELERWYDVDVEYKGEMPKETFSGEIPRSASLSELLKVFEASQIHFVIDAQHKKLTVTS